jgi:two-component system chemotaxis response regulator CheY
MTTQKHILIADDNEVMLLMLREILQKEALWNIIPTRDGQEAWNKIEEGLSPDLCILDYSMPHMDGLTFTKRIRSHTQLKNTAIILVTIDNSKSLIESTAACKISGFILKPYNSMKLIETIKRVINKEPSSSYTQPILNNPSETMMKLGIETSIYFQLLDMLIGDLKKNFF